MNPMTTIALPERLTVTEARSVGAALLSELRPASSVELDASNLRELDSAAVALLLELKRHALGQAGDLRIIGAPEKLRKLAQLYGVAELLSL